MKLMVSMRKMRLGSKAGEIGAGGATGVDTASGVGAEGFLRGGNL